MSTFLKSYTCVFRFSIHFQETASNPWICSQTLLLGEYFWNREMNLKVNAFRAKFVICATGFRRSRNNWAFLAASSKLFSKPFPAIWRALNASPLLDLVNTKLKLALDSVRHTMYCFWFDRAPLFCDNSVYSWSFAFVPSRNTSFCHEQALRDETFSQSF